MDIFSYTPLTSVIITHNSEWDIEKIESLANKNKLLREEEPKKSYAMMKCAPNKRSVKKVGVMTRYSSFKC